MQTDIGYKQDKLRIVIVAPSLDGNDLSEPEWAFKWSQALARRDDTEVTVLASARRHAVPLEEQLPEARVVTWPEPPFLYEKLERFNAMAKPGLPFFARKVRRWIRAALDSGDHFDIGHQILPQGMRHATPLRGLGIPYVIGPLGGGLATPEGFRNEVPGGNRRFNVRTIDNWRLRHDPALRASYGGADLVLGVAPYVAERLAPIPLRRFHALPERGYGDFAPERVRQAEVGKLDLFHAGRVIRTKGLRDAVRAMARLRDLPGVRLTSAGAGPDLEACKAEARELGVADRINFLGLIPREEVETWYDRADVFCFPSFREPMGGVFFEAMAHGLPIVTAANGGPDFLVDDNCGFRVPVETPEQFADGLAAAVRQLAMDPDLRLKMGQGSRARLFSFGSWDDKATLMVEFYRDIVANCASDRKV